MTTTYINGTEMNELDAIEIIDWGMAARNKPVLKLIAHIMEGLGPYVIHVAITQPKVIVSLRSYEGDPLKTIELRRWLDSYAGAQVVHGGAFALIGEDWINL